MTDAGDTHGAGKRQMLGIVSRSLSFIDQRLMDHGERVAYIADAIAQGMGGLGIPRDRLLILSLLHDIGAYKTEEIDNMVAFETGDVTAHAVYGYVFLRNTTSLGEDARAILYHHTPYDRLGPLDTPVKTAAALIFLADRIDILLATDRVQGWEPLRRLSGTVFSPRLLAAFFRAEEGGAVSRRVLDGSYKADIRARVEAVDLTQREIDGYLGMLVYSIDFRSPFTVTHTANTTAISKALAQRLGLSRAEEDAIILGAFLHDVGKIAIPYSILENPGRLNDSQMLRMRTHVIVSEEILRDVTPDEVCAIASRHHEKLNGTGYPRGLTAPALTLPQRIVAVADIVSALISRRSYKEPFPKEKSMAILADMRDKGELCPRVCGMMLDHYDHIMDEVNQADDPVIHLYETIQKEYEECRQQR